MGRKNKQQSERMYLIIQEWESSELSRSEFCRRHSISRYSFEYWQRKFRRLSDIGKLPEFSKEDNTVIAEKESFIPLEVNGGALDWSVLLRFPNGVEAEINSSDVVFLSHLIKSF